MKDVVLRVSRIRIQRKTMHSTHHILIHALLCVRIPSTYSSRKRLLSGRHTSFNIVTFRDYIRLDLLIIIQKRDKKTDKSKTPPDIIFKAVRAVKLHNLSI